MSRLKQLGKDSVVYGFGGMLAKSISFFTLPIYTRIFTPADYGNIEMLVVLSSFLGAILAMGMDSAQSMYFFKHKQEGKVAQARIVSAILQWRLLWGSGIVLIGTLAAPLLNAAFFAGKLGLEYFAIAFVSTFFAQVMGQSAEVMRLLYRPWSYISITFTQSLFSTILVLLFVTFLDQGIFGFFLGAATSSVFVALIGWYLAREYLNFRYLHSDWWPQLVRFGAPLVPAGLATYFMDTADRWFVQYYHGPVALGLFAVGAKFSMLMALAVDTFRKAWWPIAMDAMQSKDGPETFRTISRLYIGLGTSAVSLLTLLSPQLLKWLTAPVYHQAWPIVCVLAWQALFYGFFLIASAGIWKAEKTYLNLYLMSGAAAIGIFMNWLIVPKYGGLGAAIATVITYFIWILSSLIVSESLWKVNLPWRVLCSQLLTAAMFVAWYVTFYSTLQTPVAYLVAFCVVSFLLFLALGRQMCKLILRRTLF